MSEQEGRRQGEKAGKSAKSVKSAEPEGADTPAEAAQTSGGSGPRRWNLQANVAWALITGLAVGFAVGREAHRFGLPGSGPEAGPAPDSSAASAFIAADSGGRKVYTKSADFPAGWVKDSDLAKGPTLFAGLTDVQKVTVMQALNERNCLCGCTFGTLAECLHKDPNCPNSPAITKSLVELVKQGKNLDALLAAIDEKQKGGQKPAAAEAPSKPQYIEVAAWNPRTGPKDPKVTVVLFSDFQ